MNCKTCNAFCCRGQQAIFLFPGEEESFEGYREVSITRYGNVAYLETRGVVCPALMENTCEIYANRPMMCRVFPFVIYSNTPLSEKIGFDMSACPQHSSVEPIPTGNLNNLLNWFQITRPRFFGGMLLLFIKDLWKSRVVFYLNEKDKARFHHRQRQNQAALKREQRIVAIPVLPGDVLKALIWASRWAFDGYLATNKPLSTRALCEWAQPHLKLLLKGRFQEDVDFG